MGATAETTLPPTAALGRSPGCAGQDERRG